jgi:hypothetical protein
MASIIHRAKGGGSYKCHRFTRSEVVGKLAYTSQEKQTVVCSPTWGAARFDLCDHIDVKRDYHGEEVWTQEVLDEGRF